MFSTDIWAIVWWLITKINNHAFHDQQLSVIALKKVSDTHLRVGIWIWWTVNYKKKKKIVG